MKQTVFVFVLTFCAYSINAQVEEHQVIDKSSNGGGANLTYLYQHEEISGSQFFKENWIDADLIDDNGAIFKNIKTKFDVVNNKFIYTKNDTIFEFPLSINQVTFKPNPLDSSKDIIFKKGFTIGNTIAPNVYLQVLVNGKITFLKYYKKEIEEYNEYGNANKFKRFKESQLYFVKNGDAFTATTIGKKALEYILQPQISLITAFVQQNKISEKDENGWVYIIKYLNSL